MSEIYCKQINTDSFEKWVKGEGGVYVSYCNK
jgi:hypothetical protein